MNCCNCGVDNAEGRVYCSSCGALVQATPDQAVPPPAVARVDTDPALMLLLPVGRSPLSIIAGYLGLFSIIPIFAPIALIVSLCALNDLKKRPGQAGKGRAIFGLVMGIVFSIVLIVVVVSIVTTSRCIY